MSPSTWIKLLIALAIGVALGLIYGWVIAPVQFIDTTPDTLRADYRADYVLMVAEAYHADKGVGLAARRLGIIGSQTPADIVEQALQTGRGAGYASNDLSLLEELLTAMQSYQPISVPIIGTP
jgi:hypothetical protein